jgi:hypothetical protein
MEKMLLLGLDRGIGNAILFESDLCTGHNTHEHLLRSWLG